MPTAAAPAYVAAFEPTVGAAALLDAEPGAAAPVALAWVAAAPAADVMDAKAAAAATALVEAMASADASAAEKVVRWARSAVLDARPENCASSEEMAGSCAVATDEAAFLSEAAPAASELYALVACASSEEIAAGWLASSEEAAPARELSAPAPGTTIDCAEERAAVARTRVMVLENCILTDVMRRIFCSKVWM